MIIIFYFGLRVSKGGSTRSQLSKKSVLSRKLSKLVICSDIGVGRRIERALSPDEEESLLQEEESSDKSTFIAISSNSPSYGSPPSAVFDILVLTR